MRILAIPVVAALLLLHAFLAFDVWRATHEPALSGRFLGPLSQTLTAQARRDLREGLAVLADRSQPSVERFDAYQARLRNGRELLVRSLDVNPAQPGALATLATIDYELTPADGSTIDKALERISTAAELAPRVPRVQAQLGELLLRMGYSDEALIYLARSVELDASLADRVVRIAAAYGLVPEVIRDALPLNAPSLTALRHALGPETLEEYLDWIETAIDSGSVTPTSALLFKYSDAALQVDQASRLAERMAAWGPYDERQVEASRLMQSARAALRLGDAPLALELARQSWESDPGSYVLTLLLGDTARAASEPAAAIRAYRDGLGLLARGTPHPRARARLYRRIGEVHEETHRLDLAYDAYVQALQIFPQEPYAKARIDALFSEGDP